MEEVLDEYRAWTRSLFADLARAAGAEEPNLLARQLTLLYDGVTVSARIERHPNAVAAARVVAASLVDAAITD